MLPKEEIDSLYYTDDRGIILAAMKEKMQKDASKEIYAKRKIITKSTGFS